MRTLLAGAALSLVLASTAMAQGRNRGRDNAPRAGTDAPNFTAKFVGKEDTVELEKAVAESKKPVVLIFGSVT